MRTLLSRRGVLALQASAIALHGWPARLLAQTDEVPDDAVADILIEESEAEKLPMDRTQIKPFWFQQPIGERPSPTWPSDNVSFDFAHLVAHENSSEPFQLTPRVLERLLDLGSFSRDRELPKLLFGLRGTILPDRQDRTGFAPSHKVLATRPNHIDLLCLIGVWDTSQNMLALFRASTVPCADLIQKQIEGALGCNMMPSGLHQYRVGAHRAPRQPGAFRQQKPLWVMRTKRKLQYATNDPDILWDDLNGELPFDNIHAAMLSSRSKPPFFSSAGCQVVAGAYDAQRNPTGSWADFRKAAGLSHPIKFTGGSASQEDGQKFDYLLSTGKDAQLVANGQEQAVRSLRYGSSGPAVQQLQEKLATELGSPVDKTGNFDRKTLGAVIQWQIAKKVSPTGIVAASTASMLGLTWG
jgi:hypothetical protein